MLEHPDITRCLATGYPDAEKIDCYCNECGSPIFEGDEYYDISGKFVCEDCMRACRRSAEA